MHTGHFPGDPPPPLLLPSTCTDGHSNSKAIGHLHTRHLSALHRPQIVAGRRLRPLIISKAQLVNARVPWYSRCDKIKNFVELPLLLRPRNTKDVTPLVGGLSLSRGQADGEAGAQPRAPARWWVTVGKQQMMGDENYGGLDNGNWGRVIGDAGV